MNNEQKHSLDMNEKWRLFLRNELNTFGLQHPDSMFEINCWVDDNVIITAQEINDYLAKNKCPNILKTGGDIIGKSRAQFYRYAKKEVV